MNAFAESIRGTDFATLGDLKERLAEVGVDLADVTVELRLSTQSRGDLSAPLIVVVTTYAKNAEGKRYFDLETREAATEVRRFFVTSDWRLRATPD